MSRRIALVAVVAAAAFPASSLGATHYAAGTVRNAFTKAGIRLSEQAPGQVLPVVQLGDSAHRNRPWSIAVYVYPSVRQADAVFASGAPRWRTSGFAVQQVKNVIVAVVPNGRTLSKKAPPYPMPEPVKAALARLG